MDSYPERMIKDLPGVRKNNFRLLFCETSFHIRDTSQLYYSDFRKLTTGDSFGRTC